MFENIFYDVETRELIDAGKRTLIFNQEAMAAEWGFGRTKRWDADLVNGTIKFTDPGQVVLAPVQVIGSFLLDDHDWLWAWGNPKIAYELARDARLVRHYGRERGIARFDEPRIRCTMDDAWDFTALAAQLSEATGAYRGPAGGDLYAFMTFGKPAVFRDL